MGKRSHRKKIIGSASSSSQEFLLMRNGDIDHDTNNYMEDKWGDIRTENT